MIELEKFIKMGLDIDGIKRSSGVSAHTLKSLASVQLQKLGIKNVEYELLVRILTKQNKLHEIEKLTPSENKIVAKIAQVAGVDSLCKFNCPQNKTDTLCNGCDDNSADFIGLSNCVNSAPGELNNLRTGSNVGDDGIGSSCTSPDSVDEGVQDLKRCEKPLECQATA